MSNELFEGHYEYGELLGRLPWQASIPIEVRLHAGRQEFGLLPTRLDSGADRCYFHRAIGEALGFESTDSPEQIGTGGSRVPGWSREVEIVVPAWQVGGEAIRLSATVCFVDGREDLALLGLVGFFDHFVLKIDDAAQQLWWRRRR